MLAIMRAFIQQLERLCNQNRWQSKWILVPNHATGVLIGERLVRSGVNWANLRFVTSNDLSMEIAGPRLAAQGIGILDERCGPALVLRLLLDLPNEAPVYFRPLAEGPGMAQALWAAIRDLRLAGCYAEDLTAAAFASTAKHGELKALLRAYEEHLARSLLADAAVLLREATKLIGDGPVRPRDLLVEFPGACSTALERRLADALPATVAPARKVRIPGLSVPKRINAFSGTVDWVDAMTKCLNDSQRLWWLLQPADAPAPAGDGTLQMFRAAGVEAEVEEVFHRIISRGIAFDTVEIACAQDGYAELIWEKGQRNDWPITLGVGIPGTLTRPLRALLAFCGWIESNFSAERLIALLQSGDIDPGFAHDLGATAAGRIIRRSGATIGRDTYGSGLSAIAAADRLRAQDPELDVDQHRYYSKRATDSQTVADWVNELLASVPVNMVSDAVQIGDLVRSCTAFVNHTAVRSPEDAEARDAIVDALCALHPLFDVRRPASTGLELVRSQINGLRVCAELPRPGAIYVTPLHQAGHSGRTATFVVGLAERTVFPRGLEDPVLLDTERAALSNNLGSSDDRVAQSVFQVLEAIASLEGTVDLSFSCRDLRNGREMFPSWILLNALALFRPGSDVSYRELKQYLGEPASVVPDHRGAALNDSEWWLASLRGLGKTAMRSLSAAFPELDRGAEAAAVRVGAEFTPYDGLVRQAGPVLEIRTAGRAVSASTLEAFATCPFRHFLRFGLDVEPLETRDADADVWLQPAERGQLLHGIYAQFLRLVRAEGRRPVQADCQLLHCLAAERIEKLRVQIPPQSEGVFARDTAQIKRDLNFFMAGELSAPERTPVALEVTFGFVEEENEEPLATADPLAIDLGDGQEIWLRGRIDRIDRLADGRYEVIDYKTGRLYRKLYDGTFAAGRLLQHALYSRAARELLRPVDRSPRIGASTYYFVSEAGSAQRISYPGDLDVTPVLRDLAEAIASGSFPLASSEDCKWCNYGRACCGGAVQSAAKVERGEASLAAYKRLIEHA